MFKIVGKSFKQYDFKDKKTGNQITGEGIDLYYTEAREGVEGVLTGKEFINKNRDCYTDASNLAVGSEVRFYYDRYGKVDGIQLAKK